MKTEQLTPCPRCGKPLEKVTQSRNSMLNAEQFDAARLGDYFCEACPEAGERYRYFWDRDLAQSLDENAVAALSEFRSVMQNETIPAIVETMRKRAEAGVKISQLPLTSSVKTEQPSLSDANLPEELFNREAILKLATEAGINAPGNFRFHLGGKGDMYFEVRWAALRKFADLVTLETQALLAQCQDSNKEALDQKWAIWYDGSEGHDPGYCYSLSQGMRLYDSEEEAQHACRRSAYSPKRVLVYAAIPNGAPNKEPTA